MRFKNKSGITLIALVVTIIVLLILAGISVSMLTGQNGILNRATEAKEKTEIANEDEQRKLAQAEALMNTEKTTYKGVTLPEGFAPTKITGEDSIDDGLVITDGYGNEYVWVEVPRTTTVYPTAGLNITSFTDDEYTKIENDLHTYTSDYRNETSNSDTFYDASNDENEANKLDWFQSENDYNNLNKKMLKSVYQNGGFWIGRYEAGIENEVNIRKTASNTATLTPVSKQNAYPYNYVTRTQAKTLAEKVESGNYTSSLMFGVQWDLALKYIETKKVATVTDIKAKLNSDSSSIGNYKNNLWSITNRNTKYSTDSGRSFKTGLYIKETEESVLLTTGADESFSLMNIYDTAGNVWEWTLEKASDNSSFCASRGGSFIYRGFENFVSIRLNRAISDSYSGIGFRVSLY